MTSPAPLLYIANVFRQISYASELQRAICLLYLITLFIIR